MDKIRSDLKIIRQVQGGEVDYIVKDPVALKYYRFKVLEHAVIKNLDGAHSHDEVGRLVAAETGVNLSGAAVAGFVDQLKKINLIERSTQEKSLMLLEHLREERKQKADAISEGRDVLYMRFPFIDPDQFYNWLIKRIGFLWTRPFVIFFLCMFAVASTIIISHWGEISKGMANLYSFNGVGDVLLFITVLFTIIVFHENGHGLTCKRFGGEVHELGFMLIYFMPAFYANVTDAWTFQSKAAKLYVTFAGAFVELIICSIATFVWYFSTPGYFLHDLAFMIMLLAGLSSILINMNPLIKLDGYFALVDYLEVPNLSGDAAKYLSAVVRKHVFRTAVEVPKYPPRLRRILLIYGVLSAGYRIFLLTVVLLFFYRHINRLFPEMGVFLFAFVAYRLLRKKVKKLWVTTHHIWVDKKEVLMKPKSLAVAGVGLAVVLGLFFFLPLPYSHRATFVIEPVERIPVRAATEGFIGSVAVREGEQVRRGALLALLRDPDLEDKRSALGSEIAILNRQILLARAQNDTARLLTDQRRRDHLTDELAQTEARLSQLSITAPVDGTVLTPRVEERLGMMLKQGDEFCEIAQTDALQARVVVDDWDLQDVGMGAPVSLRLNAASGQRMDGKVIKLAPASHLHQSLSPMQQKTSAQAAELSAAGAGRITTAADRAPAVRDSAGTTAEAASPFQTPLTRFDVLIQVDADGVMLRPGMSGEAKIYGRNRPLAARVWHTVRDWFRSTIIW